MKSKKWMPLKPGDLVDVVAPGMKPKPKTLDGIERFLSSWGLECRVPKNIVGKDLICANDRENRLQTLKSALIAPDSKMVWCLRGGYGSFQLLPGLAKVKPKNTKLVLGLSDITSLHSFLIQQWGWSTIHGCNMDRFALGEGSALEAKRIRDLIFAHKAQVQFSLKPLNLEAKKKKTIISQVVGGNLITLQGNFATAFQIQTRGKILFFEDIGERAYRVDRVLEQMNQMGLFKGVKAVVFGQFTGGKEPEGQNLVPRLLKDFASRHSFPVLSGLPSGHGSNQHPLPLGTSARLTTGLKCQLHVDSGAKL